MKKSLKSLALTTACLVDAVSASGAEISRDAFDATPDGRKVEAITLTNNRGLAAVCPRCLDEI